MLHENLHCLITKLLPFINEDPQMKHSCRGCLTGFSSEQNLSDHIERRKKQTPAIIGFSWKDKIVFEDHHMKMQ